MLESKVTHYLSLSSAEVEYHDMMHTSSNMVWVCSFLQEVGFPLQDVMRMYYDNQAEIFLANNHKFHVRTKHIEIDYHAIHHRVLDGFLTTPHIGSSHQLADILTKGLSMTSYNSISCKLILFDLYPLA